MFEDKVVPSLVILSTRREGAALSLTRVALAGTVMVVFVLLSMPLHAQLIVNDPLNYAQNVLTAARSLQQINIGLLGLANQLKMLQNQYQNLLKLPYSSLMSIEQSYRQTLALLGSAQKLTYNVEQINQTFSRLYPQSLGGMPPQQQIVNNARERWQTSLAGYQHALEVQAGAVQSLDGTRTQTSALLSSSQTASMLAAQQAGTQVSAQILRQLADLTAVVVAQARAQSLDGARQLADEQDRQARLKACEVPQPYEPRPVQMVH
jgi:type IV secretion system protein TrbJ